MRLQSACMPIFAALLLATTNSTAQSQADGILLGGKVITMDADQPQVEAIAWKDGIITAAGSESEVRKLADASTEILNLGGRTAMPGFIESHAHFSSMGFARMNLELRDAESWDEIVRRVANIAKQTPANEWILGRGWHQEKWKAPPSPAVDGCPVHQALSAVSPNHPVVLTHASGHMAIVNAKALELAAIDDATPDPEGGTILRDSNGHATGVLREDAEALVTRVQQRASKSPARWKQAIELAGVECLENGITSFHDAGSPLEEIDMYKAAAEDGLLPIRLWVMIRDQPDLLQRKLSDYRWIGLANNYLTVRAIKVSLDGALGSHGAWLMEPYEDLNSSAGLNTYPMDTLERVAQMAIEHDFQLCVHAIGDRANHELLDLYERMFASSPSSQSRRWRIEHAQHLLSDDIPRFGKLGVIAAMQAVHCTSDAVFVGLRLGQRRAATGAYMWRDLLDSGATICNGTDAPVEDISAIESFFSSVTRQTADGVAFYPGQAMTREEALRSYTLSGAYAAFEDDMKGSLAVGKLADVVVLSDDIMTCEESQIRQAKVAMTIVGGIVKYRRETAP